MDVLLYEASTIIGHSLYSQNRKQGQPRLQMQAVRCREIFLVIETGGMISEAYYNHAKERQVERDTPKMNNPDEREPKKPRRNITFRKSQ